MSHEQLKKVFVGGLNRDASEQSLKDSFLSFGTIIDVCVMRDMQQRSRGFGFVTFEDSADVDEIMKLKKDGQTFAVSGGQVEVKRALPRTERGEGRSRDSGSSAQRHDSASSRRIFVGGLSSMTTSEHLEGDFAKFGRVLQAVVMMDKANNKSRGFGFVSFEDEDSADKVCALRDIEINGKLCEVRKAESRQVLSTRREREPVYPQTNRFYPEQQMQQRPPNTAFGANNLNSAVQLLNTLQTLVNASTLQQTLSTANPFGNLNQGQLANIPGLNQMTQNTNAPNILQLLQTAVSNQGQQASPQLLPNSSVAPPNNQLGMLLNAVGGNAGIAGAGMGGAGMGATALGGNALSNLGLFSSLTGQNMDMMKGDQAHSNAGFIAQGASSVPGTDMSNTATNQNSGYYNDQYDSQAQSSSGFGPVRGAGRQRTDSKPNIYRPY